MGHSFIISTLFCIYLLGYQPVVSQEDDDTLSRSTSSCTTILNTPGNCVDVERCDVFLKLLRENPFTGRRVIFKSLCSGNFFKFSVCCPEAEDGSDGNRGNSTGKPVAKPTGSSSNKPLRAPQCGYSNSMHDRVVGGNPAELGAWPWIANIGYGEPDSRYVGFLCGGTLVSSRHVITAAHCVDGLENLRLVRLGEHNLESNNDGAKPIDVLIEKAIVHPNFNEKTLQNDIAILKLNKDVEFTDAIHPICLPVDDDVKNRTFVGTYPFVAGWGSTRFKGAPSSVLREVQVPVIENTKCRKDYESIRDIVINDKVLCAGYAQGGKDACQGDSGGPLMFPVKASYYLIGVVSGGYGCGAKGYPGVYSRVTSHLNFILSNMN